jgi:hypothetical protein
VKVNISVGTIEVQTYNTVELSQFLINKKGKPCLMGLEHTGGGTGRVSGGFST